MKILMLTLGLWLVVPTAYAVSIIPLKFVGNQEREVNCDAAGGLGNHVELSAGMWMEVEENSWMLGAVMYVAVSNALGEVVVYGEDEFMSDSDYLWILSTSYTYAVENWSWYSMSSNGTSHGYGEFQITSDTSWQLDLEFSGEKYAGSSLSMNASIYDSDWSLVKNLERSFLWEDDWLGPEYESVVFPTGTYYLTLDVQTESQASVSGPPEAGEDPKWVESFAKGQIIADVTAAEQPILKAPWRGIKKITQGNNGSTSHYDYGTWDNTYAIDVALPVGRDVLAPANGVVVFVDDDPGGAGGREIAIEHTGPTGGKFTTVYLHLSEILVESGYVEQGEVIAKSGNSGNVTGAHLHFHMFRPKETKPEWSFDSHTMPIQHLVMKQIGVDEDFREYDARDGDLDDARIADNYFESNNALPPLTIIAYSPVDLIVTDPSRFTLSKQLNQVPGAVYFECDTNDDGEADDIASIPERKIGNYSIEVVPEPDALPTDTYTLQVTANGETIILADDVLISNIPDESYIIKSTETEIIPIIPSTIDFDPDTLNLKSDGKWITVYIELPVGHGYDASDINVGRTFLEGLLEVQHSDIQDGVLMVKFSMQDLIIFLESVVGVIPPNDIPLTVTGELKDGRRFEGSDTVRVIKKGGKK